MRFSFGICKLEGNTTSTVLFVQQNLQQDSYKWVTVEQRFPTFWLAEPFLESISMAEPLAYPMSYKLMVFRSSVTGGRGDR